MIHSMIYLVGLVTCLAGGSLLASVLVLFVGEWLARMAGATSEIRKLMDRMDDEEDS